MKRLVLLVAICASFAVHGAGDPEAGESKSMTCTACHGPDGNSFNPAWPSIAGQHESYIVSQLRAYQDGTRNDPMMSGMAMSLSEQDMLDLGAYYASRTMAEKTADAGLAESGERLYRGGNTESGVAACIACHGPRGAGNPAAGWPRVSGQHATYTTEELREYRAGNRTTDDQAIMRDIAGRMTDDEIEAVASYIQGLH